MLRSSAFRTMAVCTLLAPALSFGPWVASAAAQGSFTPAGGGGGGGFVRISPAGGRGGPTDSSSEPPVTSSHIKQYADVLGLTEDQLAALKDMHQTLLNEHGTASALMQQKIDDARAEADESGQFEGFIKAMTEARNDYKKVVEQARERLFDDLRLLLTAEQEQQWSAVERTRRRAETMGRGALSGEAVDLVALVDDMDYTTEVDSGLAPILSAYEVSLDTALTERNARQDELAAKMAEGQGPGNIMAFSTDFSSIRDSSGKVRDVNATFARQLADSLPADLKPAFESEFQRRAFPQAYASTYTQRVVDSALAFDDLTDEQKQQIADLRARLDRELDAANARLAEAIRKDEDNPDTEVLIAEQFGTPMEIRIGEELPALKEARDARSGVVNQYLDQVRSLLSPEQQARLPKREPAQRGVGAGGGMRMMVIESTTTEGDGHEAPPPPPPPG